MSPPRIATDLMTAESLPPQQAPEWIKIFPIGEWDNPAFGRWIIDSEFCRQIVANHRAKVTGVDIALDLHHENSAAPGWILGLEDRPDGVWARIRWTPYGEKLVTEGSYRYVSPEWNWEWTRPSDGAIFTNVLTGLALTNTPFFSELPAIVSLAQNPRILAGAVQQGPSRSAGDCVATPPAPPMTREQASQVLDRLAQAKVAAGATSYSDAIKAAMAERPDVAAAYEERPQTVAPPARPAPTMTCQQASEVIDKLAQERMKATDESYCEAVKAVCSERQDLREAYHGRR